MTHQEVVATDTGVASFGASESEVHGPPATAVEGVLVTAYLLLFAGMLIWALVQLWPGPTPAGGPVPTTTDVALLVFMVNISDEVRLLLLVVFTGALGGIIHAVRSVTWYIGQQELRRNWLLTYIAQPFVGSTLAFLFYLVVRGGFFSPQASFQQTSPFGFAAMAGMIGMFSPQAVLKLKDVAEIILTKPPAGKDTAPQGSPVVTAPASEPAAARSPSATNGTAAAPRGAPANQIPQ